MTETTYRTAENPITLEEARGYLARAVMTKGPAFVYLTDTSTLSYRGASGQPACSYFPRTDLPESDPRHDTPCLIGVALRLAGYEMTDDMENEAPNGRHMYAKLGISSAVGNYFRSAQRIQDAGMTWGEAFADAEELAEKWIATYTDETGDQSK